MNIARTMKKILRMTSFLMLAFVLLASSAYAADDWEEFDAIFTEEASVKDKDLEDIRGAFISANGMVIDFSFSTNTLVDGQLINQVTLNAMDTIDTSGNLRNVIQLGEGNQVLSENFDALPEVLTVIQNSMDNITLQQVNLLDISVQNMDVFRQQVRTPELVFQNSLQLRP